MRLEMEIIVSFTTGLQIYSMLVIFWVCYPVCCINYVFEGGHLVLYIPFISITKNMEKKTDMLCNEKAIKQTKIIDIIEDIYFTLKIISPYYHGHTFLQALLNLLQTTPQPPQQQIVYLLCSKDFEISFQREES